MHPQYSDTLTTPDDRGLHCRWWGDDDPALAFVVVHGLGEHSGWYQDFGQRMQSLGRGVLAYDQHGHGKSPGRRGDAPSFDLLVDDIAVALHAAQQKWPRAELMLLGHSLGGALVLHHLLDRDGRRVERAVMTNPMILPPDPPTKPQAFAAWLTSKWIPHWRMSAGIEPEELTQDTEVLRRLANDPLVHEKLSIGIGGHLVSQGHWLVENAAKLSCKLLLLVGEEDTLCDTQTSKAFADRAGDLCQRIDFPGLRHNLLLEKDRQVVYQGIEDWLAG